MENTKYGHLGVKFVEYYWSLFHFYGNDGNVEIIASAGVGNSSGFPNSTIIMDKEYPLADYKNLFAAAIVRDLKTNEILFSWDESGIEDFGPHIIESTKGSEVCNIVFGQKVREDWRRDAFDYALFYPMV